MLGPAPTLLLSNHERHEIWIGASGQLTRTMHLRSLRRAYKEIVKELILSQSEWLQASCQIVDILGVLRVKIEVFWLCIQILGGLTRIEGGL